MSTLTAPDLYRLSRNVYSDPAAVLAEMSDARLPKRLPIRAGRLAIMRREAFSAGNLWAPALVSYWSSTGRLPLDWCGAFARDVADGGAFAVYSYGTPIGWERSDGLRVVPPVSYSVSTARHQAEVRAAWGMPWGRTYSHPTRSMASL